MLLFNERTEIIQKQEARFFIRLPEPVKKVRGGTRLIFDQTGLPPEHVGHLTSGWKARYWKPLKAYLA